MNLWSSFVKAIKRDDERAVRRFKIWLSFAVIMSLAMLASAK